MPKRAKSLPAPEDLYNRCKKLAAKAGLVLTTNSYLNVFTRKCCPGFALALENPVLLAQVRRAVALRGSDNVPREAAAGAAIDRTLGTFRSLAFLRGVDGTSLCSGLLEDLPVFLLGREVRRLLQAARLSNR